MSDIITQFATDALKHVDAEIASLNKQRNKLLGMLGTNGFAAPKSAKKATPKKAAPATSTTVQASKPTGDGRKAKTGAVRSVLTLVEVRGEVHASEMLAYLQTHGYPSLTRKSLDATLSNESKRGNTRLTRVEGKPSVWKIWKITEGGKQEVDGGFQAPHPVAAEPVAAGAGPKVY